MANIGSRSQEMQHGRSPCNAPIASHQRIAHDVFPNVENQHVLFTMSDHHVRIGVVGNVDVGKSTLIGTLMTGQLDDARGSNRTRITPCKHEIESGRTSTIRTHLLGFDEAGASVRSFSKAGTDEAFIAQYSHKVVSFMDLAGHERYLRTTVSGLSRGMADYAFLLVNASQLPGGDREITQQHLRLATACGIPVIVVITKLDSCPVHVLQATKKQIREVIRTYSHGPSKTYQVCSATDVELVRDKLNSLIPVIEVSCVSGQGLVLLQHLIWGLPKRRLHHVNKVNRPFEFLVESLIHVPGVGLVVSGFVNAGRWTKNDRDISGRTGLYIGPLAHGSYISTAVKSAHVARISVNMVWAGHDASFALVLTKEQRFRLIREGVRNLVIVQEPIEPVKQIQAEMYFWKGPNPATMVMGRYIATVHLLHLRLSVRFLRATVWDPATGRWKAVTVLRPGCRARITMSIERPHGAYIRRNMRIILREGGVRATGSVISTDG